MSFSLVAECRFELDRDDWFVVLGSSFAVSDHNFSCGFVWDRTLRPRQRKTIMLDFETSTYGLGTKHEPPQRGSSRWCESLAARTEPCGLEAVERQTCLANNSNRDRNDSRPLVRTLRTQEPNTTKHRPQRWLVPLVRTFGSQNGTVRIEQRSRDKLV